MLVFWSNIIPILLFFFVKGYPYTFFLVNMNKFITNTNTKKRDMVPIISNPYVNPIYKHQPICPRRPK